MDAIKMSKFRWVIIGLLFFITIVNYIDRAAISYAIDDIAKLFHLDDNHIGLILGSFGIGYAITTLVGGITVDRYGARLTMLIAVVCWSISLSLTGAAIGFVMVFASRLLLGLAEGPNFPAMTRAVGDWLPSHERAKSLSYSLMAVPIALAIGGPIVSQLIVHINWRGMFFVLALIAIAWIPLWWVFFRNFPQQSKHVDENELNYIHEHQVTIHNTADITQSRKHIPGLWRYLLTNKTLLANYWAFFVFGYYLFFFMSWLPTYLIQAYHFDITKIGLFTILPWSLAAIMMWAVGHISDSIYKKSTNLRLSRSYPIWISQLLAAFSVIPITLTHNPYAALVFISLAVGFSMSANATYYAVNIDVAKQRAGTALGVMDACFAISGFVAPTITGWLITLTGHFTAAFVLLTLLALSSVIVILLFHRPDEAQRLDELC